MPSALVTGGSSGIGLAIARMLRDEGFDLTLASRTAEKIEAAAAEIGAHAVTADIGKEDDCIRVVAEHRERFGGMDVLVNSAGIGIAGTVESLQTKHVDLQLNINLRGLLLVSREAIPLLKETKGWIVNLASIAGTTPTPGLTVYGATKAAVIALTRSQNAELDGDGVRAIAICPGFVDTAMAEWSGIAPDEMIQPGRLRRDRAHVPAPVAARADPAGRRRARRLVGGRRLAPRPSRPLAFSRMQRLASLVLLAAVLAGCGSTATKVSAPATPQRTFAGGELSPPRTAPPIRLHDAAGRTVTLASQRGRYVLVTFLYTHCPDVCPLIAQNLNAARKTLGGAGERRARARGQRRPEGRHARGRSRVREANAPRPQFRYLIGTRAELRRAWAAWHVFSVRQSARASSTTSRTPRWSTPRARNASSTTRCSCEGRPARPARPHAQISRKDLAPSEVERAAGSPGRARARTEP